MERYFSNSQIFDSDCYVADYTNATDSQEGVVISSEPFEDIPFFHLKVRKKKEIKYIAVNLEKYPAFISGIDNCECVFSPLSHYNRPWTLLLETKYCQPDNIEGYTFKAFSQMNETYERLIDKGLVKRDRGNVYFTFSVPGHSDYRPFGAFTLSQNDTLREIQERGIHFLGENTLLVATASHILVPKQKVV